MSGCGIWGGKGTFLQGKGSGGKDEIGGSESLPYEEKNLGEKDVDR